MYALVDCNNFYCSCERLFRPDWECRPVIVLSNNDGCAIARSEEAKKLGVAMGAPEFMIRDLIAKHNIIVRSSNYTLYGSLSNRVMRTLASFVPRIELYSIDEAFLDMHNMPYHDLLQLGLDIRRTVQQNIGIPVSVGIAPTKTLAKMANKFAKKHRQELGVHWVGNKKLMDEMLQATKVQDIWGIGSQYALFLNKNGFETAADVANAPEEWVRKNMTVVGQRLLNELRGIPAVQWQFEQRVKKNICTSRSFGKLLTQKKDIREALCTYTARCAEKLRLQKSCTTTLQVFLHTNQHRLQDQQYARSINIHLERASNDTSVLLKYANQALDIIYKPGYNYVKCGCIIAGFVPQNAVQNNLFGCNDTAKSSKLMAAMDKINKQMGTRDRVRMASQGFTKPFALRCDHASQRYTTNIKEICKVK